MTTGLPLLAGLVPMVTASQWAFWLLAPIMALAALVMVFAKKPVHSALSLAVVMICLAVQYASQEAPFLFVVQIIVYTGAILMLFLFVVMLVGVDSTDSLKETLKGHKWAWGRPTQLVGITSSRLPSWCLPSMSSSLRLLRPCSSLLPSARWCWLMARPTRRSPSVNG